LSEDPNALYDGGLAVETYDMFALWSERPLSEPLCQKSEYMVRNRPYCFLTS